MTGLDQLRGFDLVSCQESTYHMTVLNSMGSDRRGSDFLPHAYPRLCDTASGSGPTSLRLCVIGSLYQTLETAGLAILTRYFKGYAWNLNRM